MPVLLLICSVLPGLYVLGLGLSIFIVRRPVIVPSRWLRLFLIAAVAPLIFIQHMGDSHTPLPLFWILLVVLSWRMSLGYSIYGISSSGLREALLAVLKNRGVPFEENMTGIILTDHDTKLSTSFTGVGIYAIARF